MQRPCSPGWWGRASSAPEGCRFAPGGLREGPWGELLSRSRGGPPPPLRVCAGMGCLPRVRRLGLRVWTLGRVNCNREVCPRRPAARSPSPATHVHVRDRGEAPAGGPLLDGGHPGLHCDALSSSGWLGGWDYLVGFICNVNMTVRTGVGEQSPKTQSGEGLR